MSYESVARKNSLVIEDKGVQLSVDPFSAQFLAGARIGVQDTMIGAGFRADKPDAVASCACGISFRSEASKQVEQTCM